MKFRKKPIEIEAIQFNGTKESVEKIINWTNSIAKYEDNALKITTLEGVMVADISDWVIKGIKGEFYPCKDEIFKSTYDKVY